MFPWEQMMSCHVQIVLQQICNFPSFDIAGLTKHYSESHPDYMDCYGN